MPLLSCTARTCLYNKNEYCSKGDILVDGDAAVTQDETCCRSFAMRSEGARNTFQSQKGYEKIDVDCKARKCMFNKDEKCDADKITITGASACNYDETRCGSFDKEE